MLNIKSVLFTMLALLVSIIWMIILKIVIYLEKKYLEKGSIFRSEFYHKFGLFSIPPFLGIHNDGMNSLIPRYFYMRHGPMDGF